VILNRTAANRLGFKEPADAVGEYVYWGLRAEASKCVVVGVIEDYHQESLKEPIKPLFFVVLNGPTMTLKLTNASSKNVSQSLDVIRNAWVKFFPNNPFDYSFLEDNYNKQYEGDEQIARLFNMFCLLAVAISCLGILALSLFSIGRRIKEISIRKVLGASVLNLLRLLTKEYLMLIVVAAMIAVPISYWGIQQWLNGFAVRISLNIVIFFIPIAVIVVIGLATVGSQALKAALRNPVENLKHD
jgi:putative ABC transport system permease protein